MIYIEVCVLTIMEQKLSMSMEQSFDNPKDQSVDMFVGNLFESFLSKKNRLAEFDVLSKTNYVEIDGVYVKNSKGFHATVSELLRMIVKPTQKLRFRPANAGG